MSFCRLGRTSVNDWSYKLFISCLLWMYSLFPLHLLLNIYTGIKKIPTYLSMSNFYLCTHSLSSVVVWTFALASSGRNLLDFGHHRNHVVYPPNCGSCPRMLVIGRSVPGLIPTSGTDLQRQVMFMKTGSDVIKWETIFGGGQMVLLVALFCTFEQFFLFFIP